MRRVRVAIALAGVVIASREPGNSGPVVIRHSPACTSAGGPAEIITDGVDGLLVPPGDVVALTAALQRLLTDEQLRTRLHTLATEFPRLWGDPDTPDRERSRDSQQVDTGVARAVEGVARAQSGLAHRAGST